MANLNSWNYDDVIAYLEPWYGPTQLEVTVEIRMSVRSAINYTKNVHNGHPLTAELSDQELLEDFMVVHWAYFVDK